MRRNHVRKKNAKKSAREKNNQKWNVKFYFDPYLNVFSLIFDFSIKYFREIFFFKLRFLFFQREEKG